MVAEVLAAGRMATAFSPRANYCAALQLRNAMEAWGGARCSLAEGRAGQGGALDYSW
ncbi:hypothetical protein [Altericroceibacterium spongiae]|uniref:hypothetical protein n=1 Tax=Altericroceibacterium spongiae TaxID=2320269 RepID=UPI001600C4B6|nr:hypothetical protein [Altericroceibacterium spongiae]